MLKYESFNIKSGTSFQSPYLVGDESTLGLSHDGFLFAIGAEKLNPPSEVFLEVFVFDISLIICPRNANTSSHVVFWNVKMRAREKHTEHSCKALVY